MSASEVAFSVPAGHTLRLVRVVWRGSSGDGWEQEHEEYDQTGCLVAVYESWSPGIASPAGREGGADGRGGFVKYSPDGRLLRRSDAAPEWLTGRAHVTSTTNADQANAAQRPVLVA